MCIALTIVSSCSIDCYQYCVKFLDSKPGKGTGGVCEKMKIVKVRLGNALNELGVLYKQKSSAMDYNKGIASYALVRVGDIVCIIIILLWHSMEGNIKVNH